MAVGLIDRPIYSCSLVLLFPPLVVVVVVVAALLTRLRTAVMRECNRNRADATAPPAVVVVGVHYTLLYADLVYV